MRTKALLSLAALAACAVTVSAQVYSANVVGYVNVTIPGSYQYSMLCNPLNNANNNIANLFPAASMTDGAQILRWDAAVADFQLTTYSFSTVNNQWDNGSGDFSGFVLNPGEAIFFVNQGADIVLPFVGEVIQSDYVNNLTGNFAYNAVGSSAPLGGNFVNSIAGLVPSDGDQILKWDVASQDLSPASPSYSTFAGAWQEPLDVNIAAGEGFFYVLTGPDQAWHRTFTVAP